MHSPQRSEMEEEAVVVDGTGEEIPVPSTEVARVDPSPSHGVTLFGTSNPTEVMQAASAVATVLTDVLRKQGLTTRIGGKDHVQVEGWQTVGSMIGVFPVLEGVEELPWPVPCPSQLEQVQAQGKRFGFKARYRAQRADGAVVGGGEAECSRTESMWRGRDDYALKSMAQTRATSKALKAPLGFVVALAGYATTPAEEMPSGDVHPSTRGQEPFGRQASPDSVAGMGRAVTFLGLPSDRATTVFEQISKDARGYMPEICARAVMRVAAAIRDAQQGPEPEQDEPAKPETVQEELGEQAEPETNPGGYPD